jgi:DNA-binding NarL/FixJ family response regulator
MADRALHLDDVRNGASPPPRATLVAGDPRTAAALGAWLAAGGVSVERLVTPERIADVGARRPAVVVLAADLAERSGLSALRRLRRDLPSARIIVVTLADGTGRGARQALGAGADACVPESDAHRALASAVHAVVAGLVCVPRPMRRLVVKPAFSHRERQILSLLVAGLTNREIAARLYLSESTVKTHLASAFAKLGVRSRRDAAALLLDPAEELAATALSPGTAPAVER